MQWLPTPHNRGIPGSGSRRPRRHVSTTKLTLAWAKDTGADLATTSVNGGAIAIGHPRGCGIDQCFWRAA
jgi:hypothetical protein